MNELIDTRRDFLKLAAAMPAAVAAPWAMAQTPAAMPAPPNADIAPQDRIVLINEDSNTFSVINPMSNQVDTTINLTSFDEEARPPCRDITAASTSAAPRPVGPKSRVIDGVAQWRWGYRRGYTVRLDPAKLSIHAGFRLSFSRPQRKESLFVVTNPAGPQAWRGFSLWLADFVVGADPVFR